MSGSLQSAGGGQAGREALRRFLCHAGPVLVQKIELSRLQISSAFLMPAARRRDYSGSAAYGLFRFCGVGTIQVLRPCRDYSGSAV